VHQLVIKDFNNHLNLYKYSYIFRCVKTIFRGHHYNIFKVKQNTVQLYYTMGSIMFYNNYYYNVNLYNIHKDWLYRLCIDKVTNIFLSLPIYNLGICNFTTIG